MRSLGYQVNISRRSFLLLPQVDSMKSRLQVEAEGIADHLDNGAARKITSDVDLPTTPSGKHGLEVTSSNQESVAEWFAELRVEKAKSEDAVGSVRGALEYAEKRATQEIERLQDQRVALRHEIAKMKQYHTSLVAKLGLAPAKAVQGSTLMAMPPRSVIMTPSEEEMATPYAATHRYLKTSDKFSSPVSQLQEVPADWGLNDEENHPMYNPDLKYDEPSQTRSRTNLRSRMDGMLPTQRLFETEGQ
jgi:hypothetical protein